MSSEGLESKTFDMHISSSKKRKAVWLEDAQKDRDKWRTFITELFIDQGLSVVESDRLFESGKTFAEAFKDIIDKSVEDAQKEIQRLDKLVEAWMLHEAWMLQSHLFEEEKKVFEGVLAQALENYKYFKETDFSHKDAWTIFHSVYEKLFGVGEQGERAEKKEAATS